ncbi:SDR family oxidoreductase [Halorubrum sp. 48-1-W]|uniref:SDR family oxidoreductase n=1 Tax=Halorubrum sp. 48-1-W TaxID=2249761 RepID=UPI0018E55451
MASKHRGRGLAKTLALELAGYDVNVNAVAPTPIDTQMMDGMFGAYGEEVLDEGAGALAGPFNVFEPR